MHLCEKKCSRLIAAAAELSELVHLRLAGLASGAGLEQLQELPQLAVLDLRAKAWSTPRVGGAPRCFGGRAGHGACFFPNAAGSSGGELLLLSGASRSGAGDSHQSSIDVLDVQVTGACRSGDSDGDGDGVETTRCPLSVEWRHDRAWGNVRLPQVRTATYWPIARSVVVWGGIGEDHGPEDSMHVVDVERRCVRTAQLGADSDAAGPYTPPARGGAVIAPLSAHEALVMCGSDHFDGHEMLTPHILRLVLP